MLELKFRYFRKQMTNVMLTFQFLPKVCVNCSFEFLSPYEIITYSAINLHVYCQINVSTPRTYTILCLFLTNITHHD